MLDRLFAVLFVLAGAWALFLLWSQGGFGYLPAFLVVGLGPIVGLLIIRYVLIGFRR